MGFRRSKATKATKAKEAVTDQVSERTDDLMAALDAAREAIARASAAASRKGAELSKEAADKLMPERARQRRREAARRRNRRLLAGAAALSALGVVTARLSGSRGAEPVAEPDPDASAGVTPLHTDGAGTGTDPVRTPPS
jgi:C4-dicarboxylate-specific signal transduction histidine kinase